MNLISEIRDLNNSFIKANEFYEKTLINIKSEARDGNFFILAYSIMKEEVSKIVKEKFIDDGFKVIIEPDMSGDINYKTIFRITWNDSRPGTVAYDLSQEVINIKRIEAKKLKIASILEDRFSKTLRKYVILESSLIDDDTLQILRSEGFFVEYTEDNSYKISI